MDNPVMSASCSQNQVKSLAMSEQGNKASSSFINLYEKIEHNFLKPEHYFCRKDIQITTAENLFFSLPTYIKIPGLLGVCTYTL